MRRITKYYNKKAEEVESKLLDFGCVSDATDKLFRIRRKAIVKHYTISPFKELDTQIDFTMYSNGTFEVEMYSVGEVIAEKDTLEKFMSGIDFPCKVSIEINTPEHLKTPVYCVSLYLKRINYFQEAYDQVKKLVSFLERFYLCDPELAPYIEVSKLERTLTKLGEWEDESGN